MPRGERKPLRCFCGGHPTHRASWTNPRVGPHDVPVCEPCGARLWTALAKLKAARGFAVRLAR